MNFIKQRLKLALKSKILEEKPIWSLFFFFGSNMFFFHSLHPKRENIDHNLSRLLQGVSTRNLSYNTKGSTLPWHTPPLYSKPWLQKPTYRLESISGEDQFVFTDDTIPLNSGRNLLQHIQPKRDKRKRKIPSF